jgi:hypothetical protein
MQVLINETANKMLQKITGRLGAVQKDANRMEGQLGAALGLPPLPRKGQSTGDFLIEQIGSRLMPVIEEKITTLVDNIAKGGKKEQG